MGETKSWLASAGLGLISVSMVMVLAWAAICLTHEGEESLVAHCVMGGLTALVVIAFLAASFYGSQVHRGAASR